MPKRKRTRKRRAEEVLGYVVTIKEWDWSYSFGVTDPKYSHEPFDEYRHLQIWGDLIRPEDAKAETVELTFIPRPELNQGKRDTIERRKIGSLTLYERRLLGLISIPTDALEPILTTLSAGRLRFVFLSATRLYYRSADVLRFSLEQTVDLGEDDEDDEQ